MNADLKADGKLKTAMARLLHRYPLFSGIVASMDVHAMPEVGTMGVGLQDDSFDLFYNPAFVRSISLEELVGVFHHEVRHLVFGHMLMGAEQYPDAEALTTATELCANERLPEPLPLDPVLLRDYPELPPDEDSDTRYGRLAGKKREKKDAPGDGRGGTGVGSGKDADCEDKGDADEDGEAETQAHPAKRKKRTKAKKGCKKQGKAKKAKKQRGPGEKAKKNKGTIDDHGRWDEIAENEAVARNLIESSLVEGAQRIGELSQEEMKLLDKIGEGWGINPGNITSAIVPAQGEEKVNWKKALRRLIGRATHQAPCYERPPRRLPHMLGIIPGRMSRSTRPRIMAAIDTSGSMTDDILAEISGELRHMTRDREVLVVECDTEINAVHEYRKPITEVHGRGGTDLRPPLEAEFLRRHRIDVAVYFTDGFGDVHDEPPRGVPVIWVLVPGGEPPAPWGKVVKMEG